MYQTTTLTSAILSGIWMVECWWSRAMLYVCVLMWVLVDGYMVSARQLTIQCTMYINIIRISMLATCTIHAHQHQTSNADLRRIQTCIRYICIWFCVYNVGIYMWVSVYLWVYGADSECCRFLLFCMLEKWVKAVVVFLRLPQFLNWYVTIHILIFQRKLYTRQL